MISVLIGRILLGAFSLAFFALQAQSQAEKVGYIDTHSHVIVIKGMPFGPFGSPSPDAAVESALNTMNRLGVQKTVILPPPFSPDQPMRFDYEDIAPIAKRYSDRFAFLGGGGTLNPMIQEALRAGNVSEEMKRSFQATAEKILESGALGFGEMTALHVSFGPGHPFEVAPADHPLFFLLADIAAKHDVPIDFHMEAVAKDMTLPSRFQSPPNPATLQENIAAFERLLSHNPKARIIWDHAGWDCTGDRTVALMKRMLQAHSNLYMNLKFADNSLPINRALGENGRIDPEWIELLRAFPDRFVIGADQLYLPPGAPLQVPVLEGAGVFLKQLPPDLAPQVAYENALRIYKLK